MFDIGFSEMLVIAVVALIVIGPERLPKVARTAGHLFGRLQRYVNDVKADITREMELDELRKLRTQVQEAAHSIEQSVSQASREFETSVRGVEHEFATAAESASPPAGGDAAAALPQLSEPAGSPGTPAPANAEAAAEAPAVAGSAPAAPARPPAAGAASPRQAALPGFEQG